MAPAKGDGLFPVALIVLLDSAIIKTGVSPYHLVLTLPSCIVNEPNSDVAEKSLQHQNSTGGDQILGEDHHRRHILSFWECVRALSDGHT